MKIPVEITEPGAIAGEKNTESIVEKELTAKAAADPEAPIQNTHFQNFLQARAAKTA